MPAAAADPTGVHAWLIKTSSANRVLYNQLLSVYPAALALRLFRRLPFSPSSVSWTAVISAHAGDPGAAFGLLLAMLRRPKLPCQASLSALLKSLSSSSPFLFTCGLQLHSLSLKLALACLPFTGSALVNFYSKASRPSDALNAFDEITEKDEVCYGAAIVGLAQNRRPLDALSLFVSMRSNDIPTTMYSISGVLRAAAHMAILEQSRMIHAHAIVAGLEPNLVVGTALVDAYGKAGMVFDARMVFDELLEIANLVTWNAILAAYAQQGDLEATVELFNELLKWDFQPDEFTFLAVLTACSNAGGVDEAQRWIDSMGSIYGVPPGVEHLTCLVGALARVGRLEDAEQLVRTMSCEPDAAVWRTLLSGCVAHHAAEMATIISQRLLELNPKDDSVYVMLANMYSSSGKTDERASVWSEMRDRGLKKEGGRSWIEVRGVVHEFTAGERKHEMMAKIYGKLMELTEEVRKLGYKEVDMGLWYHSERLAVAYGVLSGSVPEGKVLRVVKNIRICVDCHEFFKYISMVIKREIVVRDFNRYHRIQDGYCTCKDCW